MVKKVRKALKIAIVVLVLVVGGAAFFLTRPVTPMEFDDDRTVDVRSLNTVLFAALLSGGIEDPFVDINNERVYVAYDLPAGSDADVAQRFVVGAAANTAPGAKSIVALQYVDEQPKLLWTVQMADFEAFMEQKITVDQLEEKIQKQGM